MKNISKEIETISLKLSQGEDPKKIIKDLRISEREKYQLNGRSLKILMMILVQFYNIISMSEMFLPEKAE